tara:strand:- start:6015 stop:6794 length:780 start_codon:yes stop_codon:yes gene_type:complete
MNISQDKLDIELEKKQNTMLETKQGFFAPTEGDNGDTGICIHNGTRYFAVKVNNEWQFISMQNAIKLNQEDSPQSKIDFNINNIVKGNFGSYLAQFRAEILALLNGATQIRTWCVHHSFTADFTTGDNPFINYLQYSTGDVNEPNLTGGRQFIVPFSCNLKIIYFYITTPANSSGGTITYGFNVDIKKANPSNTSFTDVVSTLNLSVPVVNGESAGFGSIIPNAPLGTDEFYEVSVSQTSPASTVATKASKAVSYFSAV